VKGIKGKKVCPPGVTSSISYQAFSIAFVERQDIPSLGGLARRLSQPKQQGKSNSPLFAVSSEI
jgi:hypothetical protein